MILFSFPSLNAQVGGSPFIQSFSKSDFHESIQIWASTQNSKGIMYFAVYKNILQYDGHTWKTIPFEDDQTARSLDIDKNGCIYVGATGSFGFLKADSVGKMKYNALEHKLDSADRNFWSVWNTYVINNRVFFNAGTRLFSYSPNEAGQPVKSIGVTAEITSCLPFNNTLYVKLKGAGIAKVDGDTIRMLTTSNELNKLKVREMLPYSETQILLFSREKGFFIYNLSETDPTKLLSVSSFHPKHLKRINAELKVNRLYSGTMLRDSTYALGTITGGIYIMDKKGCILRQINTEDNLKSNTVYHLFEDQQNSLWASTAIGISHIEISSPLSVWGSKKGFDGGIMDIEWHNNKLYLSTDVGLYYLENGKFVPIKALSGESSNQVFDVESITLADGTTKLISIATDGVYEVDKHYKIKKISGYYPYLLHQSHTDPNMVYMDNEDELVSIQYANGKWKQSGILAQFENEPYSFVEGNNGVLWLLVNAQIRSYNPKTGRVSKVEAPTGITVNSISKQGDKIIFPTIKGIYTFTDSLVVDKELNALYKDCDVIQVEFATKDLAWVHHQREKNNFIDKIIRTGGKWEKDTLASRRLSDFDSMIMDGDSLLWVLDLEKLFEFKTKKTYKRNHKIQTIISSVVLNSDSVLYQENFLNVADSILFAAQSENNTVPKIRNSLNSVTIHYAFPSYDNSAKNKFRYLLISNGDSGSWSKWSTERKKEYTHLWEGNYEFLVMGEDVYGIKGTTAKYSFTVLPPIYRTFWAYIIYIVLFIGAIYAYSKLYSRRLKRDNMRLDRIVASRTARIELQKEKIQSQANVLQIANTQLEDKKEEIQQQAKALQNINESLSNKNDEINLQKAEMQLMLKNAQEANIQITKQNKFIQDSIRYAKRIQKAVMPKEECLQHYFSDSVLFLKPKDMVSGDFFFVKEVNDLIVLAVADCTGHGVPGGFMSMLSTTLLNEIVLKAEVCKPATILEEMRLKIKETLHQTDEKLGRKDGVDIALCTINKKENTLHFSGANRPIFIIRNGEIKTYQPVKNPIGIYVKEKPFTEVQIEIEKGDEIYLFSDGFPDQFGGEYGDKLKNKRFKKLLTDASQLPGAEQKLFFSNFLKEWQGDTYSQVDDILVLGVRI